MKTVTPVVPGIPATTAIQDPAARRFAEAVADALRVQQSKEYAVSQLDRAAQALTAAPARPGNSTPAAVQNWLSTSQTYQKLKTSIDQVDISAKQAILAESIARQEAIKAIGAGGSLAEEYDPGKAYVAGDIVVYAGGLYTALQATTGNLPTDTTYWKKLGDYGSVGEALSAYAIKLSDLETSVTEAAGSLTAEVTERETLAAQLRGSYTGSDASMVVTGLIHSERTARVSAMESMTSTLEAQISEMGDVSEAAILAEAETRATNDDAMVQAINTMWSITGASQAISQSGANLVTNWTTAESNYWTTLDAEVFTAGGKTIRAALAEESSVRAEFEGKVQATWTVRADVNGYVAGIGLGVYGTPDGTTSDFIVRADKFAVVMPGYDEYVPFAIGPFGMSFEGATQWTKVEGAGKPEDNATVGAPAGTLVGGVEASALVSTIEAFSSDNKLTPVEKQAIRKEWNVIEAEYAGIASQAITLGVGYSSYTSARAALGTYLNNGTAWTSGAPLWINDANIETTTDIVGTTFRQKFSDLYTARQTVLNSISSAASQTATWSGVSGYGKPESFATNGATIGYNLLKDSGGPAYASDFVATWNKMTSANISTYMANAAIDTALIKNAAITSALIANLAVGTAQIQDLSVNGRKISPPTQGSLYVNGGNFGGVWHGLGRYVLLSIIKVEVNLNAVSNPWGGAKIARPGAVLEGQYSNYFDIRNTSEVDLYTTGLQLAMTVYAPATITYVYL